MGCEGGRDDGGAGGVWKRVDKKRHWLQEQEANEPSFWGSDWGSTVVTGGGGR